MKLDSTTLKARIDEMRTRWAGVAFKLQAEGLELESYHANGADTGLAELYSYIEALERADDTEQKAKAYVDGSAA